ncbi:unnamed protein product [marine sediment metagenome]|uniref:Uncharacterized protein n=1 Tax=marine sediment metagenome TaxID=412755 RepID=X1V824_9ZZZZ
MSSDKVVKYLLKKFASPFGKVARRLWDAFSQEKLNELEMEMVARVYRESIIKKYEYLREIDSKGQIPRKELMREPKEMASELRTELDKIRNLKA